MRIEESAAAQKKKTNRFWHILGFLGLVGLFVIAAREVRRPLASPGFLAAATTHFQPPSRLWGTLGRVSPLPTGAWWLNLVLEDGEKPVPALPYQIAVSVQGVKISYSASRRIAQREAQIDVFGVDWLVTPCPDLRSADDVVRRTEERVVKFEAEHARGGEIISASDAILGGSKDSHNRVLKEYSAMGVTMSYPEAEVDAVLTKGSPFVTLEVKRPIALVPQGRFGEVVAIKEEDWWKEGCTLFELVDTGTRWLVVVGDGLETSSAPSGTSVGVAPLKKQQQNGGFVRIAHVPDDATLRVLVESSGTYANGGDVEFKGGAEYTIKWRVAQGASEDLRMLGVKHHGFADRSGFQCAKGPMYWAPPGHVWNLKAGLLPLEEEEEEQQQQQPIDAPKKRKIIAEQARSDYERVGVGDTQQSKKGAYGRLYFTAKELGRLARLASVAHSVGDSELAEEILVALQGKLERFLDREDVCFDATWGGLVSRLGYTNHDEDYGNALYSDHHFQYGYIVYAASVLLRHKQLSERRAMKVREFVLDYANFDVGSPQHDTRFPASRHKDWYDGHSWATGLRAYETGKSQESSSEAAHGYYAVAMYGEATDDTALRDWGGLLLGTELDAARLYWHIRRPSLTPPRRHDSEEIYSGAFAENGMAGSVAGTAAIAATWFGSNPEFVHGINVLPVVAGMTENLFDDPEYVCQELQVLMPLLSREDPPLAASWAGLFYALLAIVRPDEAWEKAVELQEADFDDGASKANLLHWIATRPQTTSSSCSLEINSTTEEEPFDWSGDDMHQECSQNIACLAMGLTSGSCCPQWDGYLFGCCPVLADSL